jgi:chemotaxis protein CheD
MKETIVIVRMGEMHVAPWDDANAVVLKATLGSCIACVLVEAAAHVFGLAHIMLPQHPVRDEVRGKYADTAVPALLDEMKRRGARTGAVHAHVIGGACMFSVDARGGLSQIGERNAEATLKALAALGIAVASRETGGNRGRTIAIDSRTLKPSIHMLTGLSTARGARA